MNKQEDPKTNSPQSKDKQQGGQHKKGESFDKGHNQSGYAEKEPRKKPEEGGQQPKVTNEDNAITNTDEQNRIDETEGTQGNLSDNKDPEIDTPIYDPEKTEKKIPSIKK